MKFSTLLNYISLVGLFLSICLPANSQGIRQAELNANQVFASRPEVYFEFNITAKEQLNDLSRIISIDRTDGNKVKAYANKKEFNKFLELKLDYRVLNPPAWEQKVQTTEHFDLKSPQAWDSYPSYTAYENMMSQFETSYPALCKIENLGTLTSGRKILMAKISSQVDSVMNKPQFLWVSTIHGDEPTAYVLMLRMIDYLLTNYGINPKVTNLLNKTEIYINPLMNPDGTYYGGNNTVNDATRYNANGIDLNRNFPDPQFGPNPYGEPWQEETVIMMNFANTHHISMGGNFHGGAEVVNYPWDTWQMLHADDNWWQYVCREYADTVHQYGPVGYLTDLDNGITNGYAWYQLIGGRQDYMTYFHRSREATFEICVPKFVSGSALPGYWNSNYRSMLNYMEQVTFGVQGIVTDSLTGSPLKARIFINGHDHDSSHVWTNMPLGNYYRLLYPGSYNLTYTANGYWPKTLYNVSVVNHLAAMWNVKLVPLSVSLDEKGGRDKFQLTAYPNPVNDIMFVKSQIPLNEELNLEIYDARGGLLFNQKIKGDELFNGHPLFMGNYSKGLLMIRISGEGSSETLRILHL